MDWKKLGKAILYPPLIMMILLVPVATAFLVCAMVFFGSQSPVSIASYVVAAYTLTVWCIRIPELLRSFRTFRKENKYVKLWWENAGLRMNVSLYGSLLWNVAYALLQLCLGLRHRTFWYGSLAGYYIALAVMRFFLVRYTSRHKPGENIQAELKKYRACGIVFLLMNLALAMIIFFMVYWNRTFYHHEITTIAMAAYTFTAFTKAVIHVVKYRRYNSPVYSASKAISLAAACVSMLTLESTMLTTFGGGTADLAFRKMMLGISGGVISVFIIVMAIYMILRSSKILKEYNE